MTKKIKLITITILITILTLTQATIYANTGHSSVGYLRVGLSAPVNSIRINANSLDVFFIMNGQFVNMGQSIEGSGEFTLSVDNSYYIYIGDIDNVWPLNTVPILIDQGIWRTLAGPFDNVAEAQNHADALRAPIAAPTGRRLALRSGGQVVALFDNYNSTPFFADSRGGRINIGGYYYRGFLKAHRVGANVTPVNMVHMEDYLLSVVPSEMPASWHIEALKAQTVAARSYAITRAGVHTDRGYDLCATVCCQVYLGMRQESENSTAAVNHTRGIVALHNGNIINAVYSSSSGGIADNSENVWLEASPYLRSVSDVYDTTGREWSRTFSLSELTQVANANNFNIGNVQSVQIASVSESGRVQRLVLNGQNGQITLEREMIRTFFSPSSGGSLYSRNFRLGSFSITSNGVNIGSNAIGGSQTFIIGGSTADSTLQQQALSALSFVNSVGEIVPITTGNVNVQTSEGRRVLNLYATGAAATSSSQNANVQITGGLNSTGDRVTFIGRGWGHGVGMSQHGARGMAEAGYTFDRILKHYFTGITLEVR